MEFNIYKYNKIEYPEDKIFFTSDLHFGHYNILKYCKRPWNTVEEMDEALINNWNETVPKDGIVFNLGDFAFAANSKWKKILEQLNGEHHLILGNHDIARYPGHQILNLFAGVYQQLHLKIENRHVILNHYPFLCYGGTYLTEPVIQLYGHVHTKPNGVEGKDDSRLKYIFNSQYDVGVDNNDYKPISWKQIKEIINGNK